MAEADHWSIIQVAGARVGYSHELTVWKERNGRRFRVTETNEVLTVSRFGQTVKMSSITRVDETADGQLVSFTQELFAPPAAPTRMSGRVEGARLILTTEVDGKSTSKEKPWNAECFGPNAEVRRLRDAPLQPGESRSFLMLDLVSGGMVTVKQTAARAMSEERLPGGQRKKLLKVRTEFGPLTVDSFLDEHGTIFKDMSKVLGGVERFKVTRDAALKSITGAELDLTAAMMVPVSGLENSQPTSEVVYHVTIEGEDPSRLIPEGWTQSVERLDSDTAKVTVRSRSPPETASEPKVDPQFLESNPYVQADDSRVQAHALRAAGEAQGLRAAAQMRKWVHENLKQKDFSTVFASAAEVARSLAGDCTEHAVLLCAMCRARKIPARVVIGLVYSQRHGAFVGHAWTEVWNNGAWTPLDATLARDRVPADHIKFADASLATEGAAFHEFLPLLSAFGKMRINVVRVTH